MPSEIRHLIFKPFEVAQAVQGYHCRMGRPLPPGEVSSCRAEGNGKDEPVQVRLTIVADDGAKPRHLLVDGPTLAAALILFCRDSRIPMASKAEKSLQRFGDSVCLVAALNAKAEAPS